jgi:hypothetical protein
MSSGEQVLQEIIYYLLLQNLCYSIMLCRRPLQAVRVHGYFMRSIPGLATGLTCCRRLFFGPGHCMPQLLQGSMFRASLAEHNPQGWHRSHSRARSSLSARAARAWAQNPAAIRFVPRGRHMFCSQKLRGCVCLALVRSAPGTSRP